MFMFKQKTGLLRLCSKTLALFEQEDEARVFSWLQYATSTLDGSKSYTLDL